ncbi:MAG: chorismate mutase [bacterium]
MTDPLAPLRARIDALDDALLALLAERLEVARRLGALKASPGRDAAREAAIITRLAPLAPELAELVPALWELLFQTSDAWQRRDRG